MTYNFSNIFQKKQEEILDEFINLHTSCISNYKSQNSDDIYSYYKKILETLSSDFQEDELIENFEDLANFKISLSVPYILMINEVYALKEVLISKMSSHEINSNIIYILSLFKEINNKIAYIYLKKYIQNLLSINNLRIVSLCDLMEKNIISHYESHLQWLTKLALRIRDKDKEDFPELDSKLCDFGIWLDTDAKNIIQNNSKVKNIEALHDDLHLFARKLHEHIGDNEHHVHITYLEKCEFISLSIGTELALIDNVIMNKKVTKDALTGALNRNGLRSIFESQYELSLATSNSFVLAICDLDNFKKINDTYGHIAGDKMLENFVSVTKKTIRNSDIIIRYGGEEFVIILPTLNKDDGFKVLQNVCKNFQDSVLNFESKELRATVSIGMIEIEPQEVFNSSSIDEYIMIADQRLYSAKEKGKNRVEYC